MSHDLRRGFTLIELLVVISIIALLSSVVLSSLSSAREKAKRQSIITGVNEISKVFESQFASQGSYVGVVDNSSYFFSSDNCSSNTNPAGYGYFLNSEAAAVCKSFYDTINDSGVPGILIGVSQDKYSIIVKASSQPSNQDQNWYCVDSSGARSFGHRYSSVSSGDTKPTAITALANMSCS